LGRRRAVCARAGRLTIPVPARDVIEAKELLTGVSQIIVMFV
jgi:bifunctional DNA-binding transcriptional regulator/antitoxin component of YhaV-PrlF toxin-antitoxin module